jgi:hypothetical protein
LTNIKSLQTLIEVKGSVSIVLVDSSANLNAKFEPKKTKAKEIKKYYIVFELSKQQPIQLFDVYLLVFPHFFNHFKELKFK